MKNPISNLMAMPSVLATRGMLMTACFMLLASLFSFSQTPLLTATINEQGILQLPADQELMEMYEFSLASLNFPTDEALIDFLSTKSSEYFIIRPNTGEGKGVLVLKLYDQPEWTADDWNAHLALVCNEHPIKQ